MFDRPKVQTTISQMRALIQDGRERLYALRPAWGVHLADQTMRRLSEALDQLETQIGLTGSGQSPADNVRPALPVSAEQRGEAMRKNR